MQISVIIPAYNSACFIGDTFLSLQNQTFEDFEVIVIDDGSQDNTKEVVATWQKKDPRIKYFYKENGGVSSARNMGIEKAEGNFLSFLDSDDTFEPEFLEKTYMKITVDNKCLCYSGYYHRIGNKISRAIPDSFDIADILAFVMNKQWISTDSWLIRRTFLQKKRIYFNENLHYGEDFEFFGRLIYHGMQSYTFVAEYLTNYNIRPDSLSNKGVLWYSFEYIDGSLNANKSFYDFIKSEGGGSAEHYLSLMSQKIKNFYLRWLWGTLLLDSRKNFEVLYLHYQADIVKYQLNIQSDGVDCKIWEIIVTHKFLRSVSRYLFRPYKYIQRRIAISKIR